MAGILVSTLITTTMRINGDISARELPTPDELVDGLACLNNMLEGMPTEALLMWGSPNKTFTTSPGVATYTIGPGGAFNDQRPEDIEGVYCTFGGVDFPLMQIEQSEYNLIPLKLQQQQIPSRYIYVQDSPLGRITLWPVPSVAIPLVLTARRLITTPLALTDVLDGPPGFKKMVQYGLSVEFAPEFGHTASQSVVALAVGAKSAFKAANITPSVSRCDPAIMGGGGYVNWRTGV